MKLFEVKYRVTCDDLKFNDSLLIPAKNVATATKTFESLPSRASGLMGSFQKMKVLYSFAECRLEIISVEILPSKGTNSTGPK